jgi:hypothetical protein
VKDWLPRAMYVSCGTAGVAEQAPASGGRRAGVSAYAFTQGCDKERERLGGAEFLFDSSSTHRLADLGVTRGWQCLEVGFGAGGVALWLSDQVGCTGRVVATDLDPRFLDGHGRANLEVRTHDIAADSLEEAAFDVVHARIRAVSSCLLPPTMTGAG